MDYTTNYKAHDRIDDTGKKYHVNAFTETRDIPTQFKIFFNLALFSGLRRGELVALTWDDIDTDNNILHVTKSTGYADMEMITKAPKNKSSIGDIYIFLSNGMVGKCIYPLHIILSRTSSTNITLPLRMKVRSYQTSHYMD